MKKKIKVAAPKKSSSKKQTNKAGQNTNLKAAAKSSKTKSGKSNPTKKNLSQVLGQEAEAAAGTTNSTKFNATTAGTTNSTSTTAAAASAKHQHEIADDAFVEIIESGIAKGGKAGMPKMAYEVIKGRASWQPKSSVCSGRPRARESHHHQTQSTAADGTQTGSKATPASKGGHFSAVVKSIEGLGDVTVAIQEYAKKIGGNLRMIKEPSDTDADTAAQKQDTAAMNSKSNEEDGYDRYSFRQSGADRQTGSRYHGYAYDDDWEAQNYAQYNNDVNEKIIKELQKDKKEAKKAAKKAKKEADQMRKEQKRETKKLKRQLKKLMKRTESQNIHPWPGQPWQGHQAGPSMHYAGAAHSAPPPTGVYPAPSHSAPPPANGYYHANHGPQPAPYVGPQPAPYVGPQPAPYVGHAPYSWQYPQQSVYHHQQQVHQSGSSRRSEDGDHNWMHADAISKVLRTANKQN